MASFNGSIDLLALAGAKLFTGIDQNSPNRAYVCIPVDLNDIRLSISRQNQGKQIAGLRVNIWPLNEQYKNKVRQSAIERGDNNVNVPTHEMQISYSVDYVKSIIKAFPKLVEEVKEANKLRDPNIVNQDPQDEGTHLFKAIRNRMNKRLAMLYQPQAQPAQTSAYPQPSYAQAGQVSAYVPPTDGAETDYTTFNDPDCDLPF